MLRPVYHGHESTRKLKELVRAYESLSVDTQKTMARIKAIYRGRGIRTPGRSVYQAKQRDQWLALLTEPGLRQRAAWLYDQLDHLRPLRKKAKETMLAESRNHRAVGLLRKIPQLGSYPGGVHRGYRRHAPSFSNQASISGAMPAWPSSRA